MVAVVKEAELKVDMVREEVGFKESCWLSCEC